jgi:hypothetical protein
LQTVEVVLDALSLRSADHIQPTASGGVAALVVVGSSMTAGFGPRRVPTDPIP